MGTKHEIKESIASELRQLRFDHNLTQSELAKQSNVDIGTIVRYEKNNVTMQIDTIMKLIDPYKIDILIFFQNIIAKTQKR